MLILNVMLGEEKNICDVSAVASSDLRIYKVKGFVSVFLCPLCFFV